MLIDVVQVAVKQLLHLAQHSDHLLSLFECVHLVQQTLFGKIPADEDLGNWLPYALASRLACALSSRLARLSLLIKQGATPSRRSPAAGGRQRQHAAHHALWTTLCTTAHCLWLAASRCGWPGGRHNYNCVVRHSGLWRSRNRSKLLVRHESHWAQCGLAGGDEPVAPVGWRIGGGPAGAQTTGIVTLLRSHGPDVEHRRGLTISPTATILATLPV